MTNEFFEDFDFSTAGLQIRQLGTARGDSQIFADAINAFYIRLQSESVTLNEMEACLGSPDSIATEGNSKVAVYEWGQLVYGSYLKSSTRFLIVNEFAIRVLPTAA